MTLLSTEALDASRHYLALPKQKRSNLPRAPSLVSYTSASRPFRKITVDPSSPLNSLVLNLDKSYFAKPSDHNHSSTNPAISPNNTNHNPTNQLSPAISPSQTEPEPLLSIPYVPLEALNYKNESSTLIPTFRSRVTKFKLFELLSQTYPPEVFPLQREQLSLFDQECDAEKLHSLTNCFEYMETFSGDYPEGIVFISRDIAFDVLSRRLDHFAGHGFKPELDYKIFESVRHLFLNFRSPRQ